MREVITLAELELDRCSLTYSQGRCEAVLGQTGDFKCFNTRPTCQDPDNFTARGIALQFADGDSPISTAFDAITTLPGDWTVQVVFKPLTSTSDVIRLAGDTQEISLSTGLTTGLFKETAIKLVLKRLSDGSTQSVDTTVGNSYVNKLIRITIQKSGSQYKAWANDNLFFDTAVNDGTIDPGNGELFLYAAESGTGSPKGDVIIDQVRIFNSAVRPAMNVYIDPSDYPSLQHYWKMNVTPPHNQDEVGGANFLQPTQTEASAVEGLTMDETFIYRFARNSDNLPLDFDAIPSMIGVSVDPQKLRPGEDIGKRASATVRLSDHPHHDFPFDPYFKGRISGTAQADSTQYNPQDRGTFFGKFRARNFESYFQRPLRVYHGYVGQTLDEMVKRTYVIENIEGPKSDGSFKVVGKDPLKLADDDRAQAPAASPGVLNADITDTATSLALKTAADADEYDESGYIAIGDEVIEYSRSGNTWTLNERGALNTQAQSHSEDDTVQQVLTINGNVAEIMNELLVMYADVDPSDIDIVQWEDEIDGVTSIQYEANIVQPTSVRDLLGELTKQTAVNIYYDEYDAKYRLRALKEPSAGLTVLTDENDIIADSWDAQEQPDRRKSDVWVWYGLFDPTKNLDEDTNYRNTLVGVDADSRSQDKWRVPKIDKVRSRWINEFNRPGAERVTRNLLSRFAKPPRKAGLLLDVSRDGEFRLGQLVNIRTRTVQRADGLQDEITWQTTAIQRRDQDIKLEFEEYNFKAEPDDDVNRLFVDAPTADSREFFDLRAEHDAIYGTPDQDQEVELIVNSIIGSQDPDQPSLVIGDWPDGVQITIIINSTGYIVGAGGNGGRRESAAAPAPGVDGGTALYTRRAIIVDNSGVIGGGGGGGAAGINTNLQVAGGGGGAGSLSGLGGENGAENGALETGGDGGSVPDATGGDGGDLGQDGQPSSSGQTEGSAGPAIDGDSHITYTQAGDIRGAQVN